MSIPKIVHYCWFGEKAMPAKCKRVIETWKKHLPDYEIRLWDESTFDVSKSEYTKAAYDAGKYAFVSDYARLYALKEYGGIYLDADVEVVRNFDDLLPEYDAVFGFESDLHPKNIIDNKHFEIKTPDVVIKVDPARSDLIETRVIGGVKYIMICADENVEVNGVNIHIGDKEPATV